MKEFLRLVSLINAVFLCTKYYLLIIDSPNNPFLSKLLEAVVYIQHQIFTQIGRKSESEIIVE